MQEYALRTALCRTDYFSSLNIHLRAIYMELLFEFKMTLCYDVHIRKMDILYRIRIPFNILFHTRLISGAKKNVVLPMAWLADNDDGSMYINI